MCVNGIKTVGKHVGKLLATNRTCLYSRQLFHQLFHVGKLVFDVIGKRVLVIANESKHALYSRDLFDFTKCRPKVQFDPSATWNLLKAAASSRRSYWTSVLYALREGFLLIHRFVQTFIFLHYFPFVSGDELKIRPRHKRLLCVSATVLRRPYPILQINISVVGFDVWRHELANILESANTSWPTKVCRVEAA